MQKLSNFGEEYLLLALRINKHIKGYVDFYFGPEKLRKIVENESIRSPKKLLRDSISLIQQLGAQGYDLKRKRYLEKLLVAMKTSIESLNGIIIPIEDQFLKIYDVSLQAANESDIHKLKNEFNEAYSGPGSLEDRLAKTRIMRSVPENTVLTSYQKALTIAKKQTVKLFPDLLPEGEYISVSLVKNLNDDIKWPFYNWYLGNYHSQIEVNPKFTVYWTSFLAAACHEGYPGHHTEFVLNEKKLYREMNQFEHSLLILHSPKMIISEGIANLANSIIFSNKESAEISLREFCPNISKEASLERLILQNKVRVKLSLFWYNFAYHALVDKYSEEELIQYGKSFEVFSEEVLKVEIKRLSNPAYSKNAFLYNLGTKIIVRKYGKIPSLNEFKNLLINPILPSDLT